MKKLVLTFVSLALSSGLVSQAGGLRLDELKVDIHSSREFSYSDKQAGFFYGMTNTDHYSDGNAGWNIRARRVLQDYALSHNGTELMRETAQVAVYPDRLVRKYDSVQETFRLVDNEKVIFIDIESSKPGTLGIRLLGDIISQPEAVADGVVCRPKAYPDEVVRISTMVAEQPLTVENGVVTTSVDAKGFILTFGTLEESLALASTSRAEKYNWIKERRTRMQQLISDNALRSNIGWMDRSLAWIELTADELVTYQHGGWGIYAGLPWFTDFWGRDMFISMPGTVLCTGQFDVARNILESFAKYMDVDPKSPTYGRVPNRLNLEGILYNTTDGTPRFVMQVYEYLKYTGDIKFIKTIYKSVKTATDASLQLYVDENGYLTHADADTWMDAKRQSVKPCSPRGNRAVDIQALWYGQLDAAARLADYMGKKDDASRWREAAAKLKANFEKDFIADGIITDHLNADGSRDNQLRPNTMYAYDLVTSEDVKINDIRTIWSQLVYPWGVSSLSQWDDQFHPYHEQWHRYHKDDAYHNGTIWLWQNGMAMEQMINYYQTNKAFVLFQNMNRQALDQGAVGSLAENADAWCRPGASWVRRSGTFLQAWSNAEQIRAWSQCFLGVMPDMLNCTIHITPRLPRKINSVDTRIKIGDGALEYGYRTIDRNEVYDYRWTGSKAVTLSIDLPIISDFSISIPAGGVVTVESDNDKAIVTVRDAKGNETACNTIEASADKKEFSRKCKSALKGVNFATPCYRENLKSMSRYFDPPLDYYSAE